MCSPCRHLKDISYLKDAELLDLIKSVTHAKRLLEEVLRPDGFNIGINISKSAGAGITGHVHIHIVPRWHGDTNFMPAVHNTRVISQSLDELYKRLRSAHVGSRSD
jgi:ATP adenylyltransferase